MNSLRKIQKLRKMSLGEIRSRAGDVLRRRWEKRLYRKGSTGAVLPSMGGFDEEAFRNRVVEFVPGSRQNELEGLGERFSKLRETMAPRAVVTAEKVLSGSWPLLGHSVDLRYKVDWHRDLRSDYRWPKAFYADLSLRQRSDDGVDVKYVWELGRHQYLVDLTRGHALGGEQRFAQRVRHLMLDFIRRNPLYEGIHWTSGLEVAMRSISWIWSLAALADWDGWQDGELELVTGSLAEHADYLKNHFSFYSSPYNHLVGEATGLYLIGIALSQFGESANWRRVAREVLETHGPRQFYADGFCVEQAVGYHFYTLGFLSLAIAAARRENSPMVALEQVAHRAYRAGAAMRQPDGRWPAIGDVDSARSIPVHHEDYWDFGSLCALAAVLFDDPQLKAANDHPGDELYWLLGTTGLAAWHELPDVELPRHIVLPDSGYVVARGKDDWLLFDAGPIGAGVHSDATASTAHGHNDTLQVLFFADGRPTLLDPGMPFYFGSSEWVGHFRGAGAHNTLEVEGSPMARHAGLLDWSHVAPPPKMDVHVTDEAWLLRGRADGMLGVLIERNVLGLPGHGIWIADWIECDSPRRVRWFWQLPTGTFLENATILAGTRCTAKGTGLQLTTWSDSVPIRAHLETAKHESPVGWKAHDYGMRATGQRLSYEAEPATRFLVVTHVGRRRQSVEVQIRGRHLSCNTAENGDNDLLGADSTDSHSDSGHSDSGHSDSGAGIVWNVMTERGLVKYTAGNRGFQGDSARLELTGAGS